MPVGVMCFQGLLPQLPALTAFLDASPATTLIIDHFGFFRQVISPCISPVSPLYLAYISPDHFGFFRQASL